MTISPRFRSFVREHSAHSMLLPLAHSTDNKCLIDLLEAPRLLPKHRPEYEEDLFFTYYGRPSYRLHPDIDATSVTAVHATAFLLDPRHMPLVHRVVAFDSGAMDLGLYKSAMHRDFTKQTFEVDPDLESASRIVRAFYDDHEDYCAGKPNRATVSEMQPEAQCYQDLLTSKLAAEADDRKSCVEIQFCSEIALNADTVLAVILPKQSYKEPTIRSFIDNELEAKALTYICTGGKPSEDAVMMKEKAFDFYFRTGRL